MDAPWVPLALRIAGFVLASTFLLLLAAITSRALIRQSAALRHAIWTGAFAAALLIPAAGLLCPGREIAVAALPPVQVTEVPANDMDLSTLPINPEPPAPEEHSPANPLVALWLAGSLIVATDCIIALILLKRLRRRSAPIAEIDTLSLSQSANVQREWELRRNLGFRPAAAMTWGVFKPTIMLPQASLTWPRERTEAVVLHELAHVRRWDCASQLVATAACALYWFNPVVWLCARAMRAEAEIAADDAVLRTGITPSAYAEALLDAAKSIGNRKQPLCRVGVSFMKSSKIEKRILSILNPHARRRGATAVEAMLVCAAGILAAVSLGALRPAVVQESNDMAPVIATSQAAPKIAVVPAHAAVPARPRRASKRKHIRHQPMKVSIVGSSKHGDVVLYTPSVPAAPKPISIRVNGVPAPPHVKVRKSVAPASVPGIIVEGGAAPKSVDIATAKPATPATSVNGLSGDSAPAQSVTIAAAPKANSINIASAQGVVAAPRSADSRPARVTLSAPAGLTVQAKGQPWKVVTSKSVDIVTAGKIWASKAGAWTIYTSDGRTINTTRASVDDVESYARAMRQASSTLQSVKRRHESGKQLQIAQLQYTIAKANLQLALIRSGKK